MSSSDSLVLRFLLTRPLRDVTETIAEALPNMSISTHTPLAGRDEYPLDCFGYYSPFLLTRPLRDVTETAEQPQPETAISTHTPLAGRDADNISNLNFHAHFYSHAPCGT